MLTRRQGMFGAASVALMANAPAIASDAVNWLGNLSDDVVAKDELFWSSIARAYRLDGHFVILNGGGNNPHPSSVVDALNRYDALASSAPRPHNYVLWNRIEEHRTRIAKLMDCEPDELAITRNTTEGLNIAIWGKSLNPGDEILISNFEHSYGQKIVEQRARRHRIVVKQAEVPVRPSQRQVLRAFEEQMGPRTKLIVASHLVDGWGYVLPIRELSEMAHDRGARLLADGALSFGHVPVSMRELGCDYYATSLHKWLNAPLGTGALYVRQDRIDDLWPMYGTRRDDNDIRKFEDIGTRSGSTLAAIGQALDFYEQLGPSRKAARVKYLASIVIDQLANVPKVSVITESDPARRTGLTRIMINGVTGRDLTRSLQDDFGIFTWGNWPGEHDGVYISPNVFNSTSHMHRFAEAIREVAERSA